MLRLASAMRTNGLEFSLKGRLELFIGTWMRSTSIKERSCKILHGFQSVEAEGDIRKGELEDPSISLSLKSCKVQSCIPWFLCKKKCTLLLGTLSES